MEPPATASAPLSWQSTSCALAIIAITTSASQYGSIYDVPPRYIAALRTSPFFCLFDIINVLLQIVHHARAGSLRQAMQTVAFLGTKPIQPVRGRERTRQLGKCLCLAAATSQSVKLLACRGIPWTQAFAAAYVGSYLLRQLLSKSGESALEPVSIQTYSKTERSQLVQQSGPSAIALSWLLPQMALWILCLSRFIPAADSSTTMPEQPWPTWHSVTIIPVAIIIIALGFVLLLILPAGMVTVVGFGFDLAVMLAPSAALLYSVYFVPKRFCNGGLVLLGEIFDVEVITICSAVGAPVGAIMVYWQTQLVGFFPLTVSLSDQDKLSSLRGTYKKVFPFIANVAFQSAGGTFILLAAGMTSFLTFQVLFMGKLGRFNPFNNPQVTHATWVYTFTFCANLATAVAYYMQVYDERGTIRPEWTTILG